MVGSLMEKLFGTIMQENLSAWAEESGNHAHGQAGFCQSHSTIDHLVTF